jgi:transmembrane sensor
LDELILQTLTGSATPSVEEQVRRWRAESPENEAYFRGLATVWSATEPEPAAGAGVPADPQLIIAEAERRRAAGTGSGVLPLDRQRKRPGRWRPGLMGGLAIAAGIAAVAVSLRLLTLQSPADGGAVLSYRAATAPRTVVLDDGSFVRLAAGAVLAAGFTGSRRVVRLRGRAFFAVAHDPARPFVVQAGDAETRVLGTRFEVAETDGTVRTIVVDGRVAFSNGRGKVEVSAGDVARAEPGSAPTAATPADIRALLDWPGGLLLFQGTPLGRVAEEVARFFGRNVVVESDALQALRISGSFDDEGFEEVVQGLCDAAGAVCRLTPDGAVLSPSSERSAR